MDRLEQLKQLFITQRKPFPLYALLILYENGPRSLYYQYFEEFKLLVDWLGPIDIPESTATHRRPKLFHSYDIQEIAVILNTTQDNIYYAYRHSLEVIKLQQSANIPLMPTQIPIVSTEFESQ